MFAAYKSRIAFEDNILSVYENRNRLIISGLICDVSLTVMLTFFTLNHPPPPKKGSAFMTLERIKTHGKMY